MKLADQANIIRRSLNDWAKAEGGKALVVFDQFELWDNMFKSVSYPRVLICYEGEKLRGDFSIAAKLGRVDRQWIVGVTRARGLNVERGDSLTKTVGNARPFLDLVEEARDLIRSLQGITLEPPVDFISIEPAQRPDALTDAYLLRFSIVDNLPRIKSTASQDSPATVGFVGGNRLFQSLPCNPNLPNNSVLPCDDQPDVVTTMQGVAGVTYDVTFNMASILEGKTYTGGTVIGGRVVQDATPASDALNIIKLVVSSPPATYYLNNGITSPVCDIYQTQFTIPINTGATVTLVMDSVDGNEATNYNSFTIPGYAGILPNFGEWTQLDVITYQAR